MGRYDKYYVVSASESIECDSLLEVSGKLGGLFDKGEDLAAVMIIRKDNK